MVTGRLDAPSIGRLTAVLLLASVPQNSARRKARPEIVADRCDGRWRALGAYSWVMGFGGKYRTVLGIRNLFIQTGGLHGPSFGGLGRYDPTKPSPGLFASPYYAIPITAPTAAANAISIAPICIPLCRIVCSFANQRSQPSRNAYACNYTSPFSRAHHGIFCTRSPSGDLRKKRARPIDNASAHVNTVSGASAETTTTSVHPSDHRKPVH
jgi:hypothetical protein